MDAKEIEDIKTYDMSSSKAKDIIDSNNLEYSIGRASAEEAAQAPASAEEADAAATQIDETSQSKDGNTYTVSVTTDKDGNFNGKIIKKPEAIGGRTHRRHRSRRRSHGNRKSKRRRRQPAKKRRTTRRSRRHSKHRKHGKRRSMRGG